MASFISHGVVAHVLMGNGCSTWMFLEQIRTLVAGWRKVVLAPALLLLFDRKKDCPGNHRNRRCRLIQSSPHAVLGTATDPDADVS